MIYKREDFRRIKESPNTLLSIKSMLIYLHICKFFQFNLKKNWQFFQYRSHVSKIFTFFPIPCQKFLNYGIVTITHSIGALSKTLVDLCNTKVVFGRSVSTNVSWYRANIGKERTMELGFLEQGQCILDTRQTAVSINVKLDIPFIGKDEDYFG